MIEHVNIIIQIISQHVEDDWQLALALAKVVIVV